MLFFVIEEIYIIKKYQILKYSFQYQIFVAFLDFPNDVLESINQSIADSASYSFIPFWTEIFNVNVHLCLFYYSIRL